MSVADVKNFSRRTFLAKTAKTIGTVTSLFYATGMITAPVVQAADKILPVKDLTDKFGFKGRVLTPDQPEFNEAAFGGLWNHLRPTRHPQILVQVTGDDDVIAAIKFAKANHIKVTVRGGGHNWCNPSLRNSGMLIDLTNLTKVISIDAENKKAIVEPIISNRDIQKALNAKGLSYPSGHCPEVKLSGYLLSGGMAWNQGEWGPGVGSVEAIELVTADGELIKASATQNHDYFWAARGSGCSFFGVVLRYHLKLYDLPKAITSSVYYYYHDDVVKVAEWLQTVAPQLSNKVELSLFVVKAPADLKEQAKNTGGVVAMVTGTMFANTADEGKAALALLDTCPVIGKCLKKSVNEPMTFEQLFDASGALWPAGLRSRVDAMFSDASPATIFSALKEHNEHFPSDTTVFMFAIFTGKNVPAPLLTDAAFSMSAKLYGGPWTMWQSAGDDAANSAWHDKCVKLLAPHVCGHYVSESNTVLHPEFARGAFKKANWDKLQRLKAKHDPQGLFFDFTGGLT